MTDRSGNVYENKGLVFHSPMESGNVIENKDSYQLRSGILLKTQHVSGKSPSRSVWHDGPSRFRRPCASGSRVGPGLAPGLAALSRRAMAGGEAALHSNWDSTGQADGIAADSWYHDYPRSNERGAPWT